MISEPTPGRILGSVVATLVLAVAVWWFVEWRSAPPPPPHRVLPQLETPGH